MEKLMQDSSLPLLKGGKYLKWLIVLGVFWFALGMAYIPVNKIYQQGVVVFLFLPLILMMSFNLKLFSGFLIKNNIFSFLCGFLFLYIAINGVFFDELQGVKHVLYVIVFLSLGFFLPLFEFNEKTLEVLFFVVLVALAIICLYSFYNFFYSKNNDIFSRMWGVLGVNHPILASYYIGFFFILSFTVFIEKRKLYMVPFVAVFTLFILFAQSRGAYIAVLMTLLLYLVVFARKNKFAMWSIMFFLGLSLILGYVFSDQVVSRGMSFRPEIMLSSLAMGVEKLWFGHGIGYKYLIYTSNHPEGFDHAHNLPLHVFIRLGLFGFSIFSAVWLYCFYYCYKNKELFLAKFNFLLIIFSSIAFQFDSASLIAQPRLEWFVVWVPICITVAVMAFSFINRIEASDKLNSIA